jgi:hypothetical protein
MSLRFDFEPMRFRKPIQHHGDQGAAHAMVKFPTAEAVREYENEIGF